jgi:hypothetical protein
VKRSSWALVVGALALTYLTLQRACYDLGDLNDKKGMLALNAFLVLAVLVALVVERFFKDESR